MLKETASYLHKLQTTPTFATSLDHENDSNGDNCDGAELRSKMAGVKGLYVKMHAELAMAKNEIAWGKLRARDINATNDLFRRVLMPL